MDTVSATAARERAQDALRADLTRAAIELFGEHGYAATTVGQIAEQAGVTERTFFRHFAAKEDPILQPIEQLSSAAVTRLRERPADEPPVKALREALGVAVEFVLRDPSSMRRIMDLNRANPELRSRHILKQTEWIDELSTAMAERMGLPATSAAARLPCALTMAAYEKALATCADEDRFADVVAEFDLALTESRALLGA